MARCLPAPRAPGSPPCPPLLVPPLPLPSPPPQIAPTAMIFIPCRNGWSHRPDEYASPADIARGVQVGAGTICGILCIAGGHFLSHTHPLFSSWVAPPTYSFPITFFLAGAGTHHGEAGGGRRRRQAGAVSDSSHWLMVAVADGRRGTAQHRGCTSGSPPPASHRPRLLRCCTHVGLARVCP